MLGKASNKEDRRQYATEITTSETLDGRVWFLVFRTIRSQKRIFVSVKMNDKLTKYTTGTPRLVGILNNLSAWAQQAVFLFWITTTPP